MALLFLKNIAKTIIFFLLLFTLSRSLFLIYFAPQILPTNGFIIFFQSLAKALPLDISTACYLTFLPLLLLFTGSLFFSAFFSRVFKFYMVFVALFSALFSMVEIGVYREVHVKLYFNLLTHLQHISELVRSVSVPLLATVLGLTLLLGYFSVKLLNYLFRPRKTLAASKTIVSVLQLAAAFVAAGTLLVIGCRGGFQPIPINEGQVYFSNNQCVNDATVNPLWSIVHSYIETKHTLSGGIYKTMPDSTANLEVSKLFVVEKDTTIHLLNASRPNICIVILESWPAEFIESLGGYKGLTPNFEKLVTQGYLFTNLKPAGHMSDQGVPAILSGYPALPVGSAINQPGKQVNLASINNQFSLAGYYSSFFFGGQLIFGNIKTYVYQSGFKRVIEQSDLPSSLPAGKLGIHDSLMLSIWHDSLNTYQQPFLSALFTLSTHSPFDAPTPAVVNWGGMHQAYLNCAVYSDRQLGKFFEDIKKEKWFDSTVFLLVADHSHGSPKDYVYDSPEFYHIPFLIYGNPLKKEFRGAKNNMLCSQTDIASTLLHQLGFSTSDYRWSKNLMNPYTQHFAFYTFDGGYGFADSTGVVVSNTIFPSENRNTGKSDAEKKALAQKGAAMIQVLMNDFLSK